MVTNVGDIKYMEEASQILNVSSQDLEEFIKFVRQLEEEKLRMILNSAQTTITGNIRTFLYNLYYHDMITLYGEGGLRSLNKDEIANLVSYINNVAERINSIQQKNSKTETPITDKSETIGKSENKDSIHGLRANQKEEKLPQIPQNVQEWIERGQKIVSEDKKIAWEEYVKKSVQDQFINLDIEFILEIMEKVASGTSKEEVSELISQRNYSDLFSRILRKIIKEFLGKDIEIPKEKKSDVQQKEELSIPKAVRLAMSVRDTIPSEQRKEIDELINKIMSLAEKRRQAKEEVNAKMENLDKKDSSYGNAKNNYKRERNGYEEGYKIRHTTEIKDAQLEKSRAISDAKTQKKDARKEKNKTILQILSHPRAEKSEEEKGILKRIKKARKDYKESVEGIIARKDTKVKEAEEKIAKLQGEINQYRENMGNLRLDRQQARKEVESAKAKLYDIEKEITRLSQSLEDLLKQYDKLPSQGMDR